MTLSQEQQSIRDLILTEAQRRNLPLHGRVVLSALETGLVESGLRNLPGGDADSQGWRQERASLYPNPRNVRASIRRYFDEATQLDTGRGSAGQLAARVQRPAAQYRGRYDQRRQDALALLPRGRAIPSGSAADRSSSQTTTTVTPAQLDTSQADITGLLAGLVGQSRPTVQMAGVASPGFSAERYLNVPASPQSAGVSAPQRSNLADLLSSLPQGAENVPGAVESTTTTTTTGAQPKARGGSFKGSPLFEMFWQGDGGINVKNGRRVRQGFVTGHTDHVHVAAGPKTAVRLGRIAQQKFGLTVRENEAFDPVDPVHTQGSYHYRNRAIDVSGDPKKMAAFARYVAGLYGV